MLAHLLTSDERMTVGKFVGVLIGFTGVAVMIGQDAMRDLGTGVIAQFLCLAGAVSYAFAGIYGGVSAPWASALWAPRQDRSLHQV